MKFYSDSVTKWAFAAAVTVPPKPAKFLKKTTRTTKKPKRTTMGTHTISNTATLHGWLESVGLDDFLANPGRVSLAKNTPRVKET